MVASHLLLTLLPLAVQAIITPHALFPIVGPYVTQPLHIPVVWQVKQLTTDTSLLSDGYFMYSPRDINGGWGPHIYNILGDLVWDGALSHPDTNTNEFRVCDFKGVPQKFLCFHDKPGGKGFDTLQRPMGNLGDRVLDENYNEVGIDWTDAGEIQWRPDNHEFNMLPGGESFVRVFDEHLTTDMTPYGGTQDGIFVSNAFQDVDVRTGAAIFTWRTGDHLVPWWTYIFPSLPGRTNLTSGIAGTGAEGNAWDPYHLNAIDRNEEGDYFVSIRHMNSIIKIAGLNNRQGIPPGEIIWKLGGKVSDFEMDFVFSRQHDVRHVSTSGTETVITLFNNAWEGWAKNEPSSPMSSAMIIAVNNETMTARLVAEYKNPDGALSGSRGSADLQPNGNVLVSWGLPVPQFTEFAPDGKVLLHTEYTYPQFKQNIFSYRGHKMPWVGKPTWKPKVTAYTQNCDPSNSSPLFAYASWNGATEVVGWRMSVSERPDGPWIHAGTFSKAGFETKATLVTGMNGSSYFMPYVLAEALGQDGEVLSFETTMTYVPGPAVASQCDVNRCVIPKFFYEAEHNWIGNCEIRPVGGFAASSLHDEQSDDTDSAPMLPPAAQPFDQEDSAPTNEDPSKPETSNESTMHSLTSRPWALLSILAAVLTVIILATLGVMVRSFFKRRSAARRGGFYKSILGHEKGFEDDVEEITELTDTDSHRSSHDEEAGGPSAETKPLTAYRDVEE